MAQSSEMDQSEVVIGVNAMQNIPPPPHPSSCPFNGLRRALVIQIWKSEKVRVTQSNFALRNQHQSNMGY